MTDLVNRRRISVDWDGTCIVDHTWPGMGGWLPGAKEALHRLAHIYDEVVIHTLRVAPVNLDERTYRDPLDQIDAIAVMLEEARMPWNVYVWTKPYKPPAEFYVDDRAIRFEGDWDAVLAKIAVARATNQRENQMHENGLWGCATCAPSIHQGDPGDEQPFEHDSPYPSDMFDEKGDYVPAAMRTFGTGATRNADDGKHDYRGFLSEIAFEKIDSYTLRQRDLAWAGGLFEGEGHIGLREKKYPTLEMKTTDADTLRKFASIVGYGKVNGPYQVSETKDHKRKSTWKPYYAWAVSGVKAMEIATLLFPYLQSRRQATLIEKWGVERLAEVSGISPLVIQRFGEYMQKHQRQADGSLRASDNWKKGIPVAAYMQSLWRHLQDLWLHHEGYGDKAVESLEDSLCAIIFNAQGMLHELVKEELS